MSAAVELEGVSFRYAVGAGSRLSDAGVQDLSLQIEPGECILLTGDSGSGKSTLLQVLSGLIPHFHPGELIGSVRISASASPGCIASPGCSASAGSRAGTSAGAATAVGAGTVEYSPAQQPLSRAIEFSASVFQNPRTQFFTDTVDAELAFGLENLGVEPSEIEARIRHAVAALGIEHLRGRNLRELSGGQLQVVACACALVCPGGLVLLDEPSSNLSLEGIRVLQQALHRLKELGKTVVIAEHRLFFLREVADKVFYLHQGSIARTFNARDFFTLSTRERQALGLRALDFQPLPRLEACLVTSGEPSSPSDLELHEECLELRSLRFAYGRTPVIDIEHLAFPAGEVCALLGPNGAGKTTLARLICGLAAPQRGGKISLGGVEMSGKQRLAVSHMVMQDVGRQLFAATVEEELTLGLNKAQRAGVDVAGLLAAVELDSCAQRHPQSLSGGQRQRLAIAVAQANSARAHSHKTRLQANTARSQGNTVYFQRTNSPQPQVYIFDEPTSGVGWRHLQSIAQLLRALAADGAVVIVITHDYELVAAAATRMINLKEVNRV
ncbi:ABC transporter ATP-binding protein [Corynebacterium lizhenjunii]|uniref:ABC transporter ATP-binding protein n=1 Tax=Corynebacterium lizhenjunii TaxID=2709394 RepID=A0A7T0KDW6_9CORY|nr:ABC transporter ATP-binding protein [Corynebacterium lizhenjunii]QPK78998.1 ABC transporter ATP-binding protein [Corynebacterium lizhenjunii]